MNTSFKQGMNAESEYMIYSSENKEFGKANENKCSSSIVLIHQQRLLDDFDYSYLNRGFLN